MKKKHIAMSGSPSPKTFKNCWTGWQRSGNRFSEQHQEVAESAYFLS
jgi:hypothetical protein